MTNLPPCATNPLPTASPGSPTPRRLAAQEITGCRWIDGDVRTGAWRYCQQPRLPGRSYCGAHHDRSINPNGDQWFEAEQADCERYLPDLPPPIEEADAALDHGALDRGILDQAGQRAARLLGDEGDGDEPGGR